jgi:5-hydroxyisourate hydrolase-like protein (transthyretin family)
MKRLCLLLMFTALVLNKDWAQISTTAIATSANNLSTVDSATQTNIKNYYNLGLQYKDGKGVAIDYTKAYSNFLQAANLGDAQSIYAVAYMLYKGLGCTQDYAQAAELFAQGAYTGRENSMYFYGLCLRNGYGVAKNEDSAKYYLQKSADLGYKQATLELASPVAENINDSVQVLLQQISNAAIPDKTVLNRFNKVQPHLSSANIIAGEYTGWLIQYDWSGTNIVATKKLQLNITNNNNNISGEWLEEGTNKAKIKAKIQSDSLVFEETKYARSDHYSFAKAISYNFENAKLNMVQLDDSVFLTGNIEMFSPARGEPSKPIFIALSKGGLNMLDSLTSKLQLTVYPNPFTSVLNVQFNLPNAAKVSVQLYSMSGALLYNNEAGTLNEGRYNLPVQSSNLVSGMYLLKFNYGQQSKTVKVMKQ